MPNKKYAHVLLLPGESLRIICARSALDDEDDETLSDVLITNDFDKAKPRLTVCLNQHDDVIVPVISLAVPPNFARLSDIYVTIDGRNSEYQQLITMLK